MNPNRIGEYPVLWLDGSVGVLCYHLSEAPDLTWRGDVALHRCRVWVPFLGWVHVFAEGNEEWLRARVDAAWAVGLLASGLGARNDDGARARAGESSGLETDR